MPKARRRPKSVIEDDESNLLETEMSEDSSNINGDEWNISLLLLLYLLQGIPLGLSSALPMLLQNRGASFKQQAAFSFAVWPFSLKLLWAPLVDSLYIERFGRRKTWLIPAQTVIGLFLIFLSYKLDSWLGQDEGPCVLLLAILFFILNFLVATQDIAVDGWALTMLKRENIAYASTCNSAGQMAGYFLGYVLFIALESASFCNSYLRSEPLPTGLVTLSGFFYFWGVVYLVVTCLITFLKHEQPEAINSKTSSIKKIVESYKQLIRILRLPSIQLLALVFLTSKIGFAACDGVTQLKLTESGVPRDKLALLAVPLVPLQVVLPVVVSRIASRRRPMDLYNKVYPYRLMFNVIAAVFVLITPSLLIDGDIPVYYYLILLVILALQQVTVTSMFVQSMAFYAYISDPLAGGTYMTLLNTISNLGGTWTTTSALAFVGDFTYKSCTNATLSNDCSTHAESVECEKSGGACITQLDGYYIVTGLLTVFGFIWFKFWGQKAIRSLESRSLDSWTVRSR